MRSLAQLSAFLLWIALCGAGLPQASQAQTGLRFLPPWQMRPAKAFSVRNGVLFADGEPFPLHFEFTWSAPHSDAFLRYVSQFLGTVHYEPFSLNVGGQMDFTTLDRHYESAARHHVYCCIGLSVAHPRAYLRGHPEAAMRKADGTPSAGDRVSYLDTGYRQALREALRQLAMHVRDKPYHFGYYPQDEFSYADYGGYEEPSLRVFRERLLAKYGSLEGINRAWGTRFATLEAVRPPDKPESTRAWADFQEHRMWAQRNFATFVTTTLHEFDPHHLVIWSLPFWGSTVCAANWWRWPESTDILMRHGIAFSTGIHRMAILRDIAERSGKAANALCMPPDYNPDYVQMMFLLEAARTGLSHVCVGGSPEHTYYQGAADSTAGWKRKEPIYTASRNLNALVRTLGSTFLLSQQRPAQVGVFQSERTLALNGIENRTINGILLLLLDLNLDYRIFWEGDLDQIGRFPAVIVGPFTRCLADAEANALRTYVEQGGHLIFVRGAGEADECNRVVGTPGFGLEDVVGSRQTGEGTTTTLLCPDGMALPVTRPVSQRALFEGVQALARTEGGAPVVSQRVLGKGRVLYVGADLGTIYQSAWKEDFGGLSQSDADVIDANAFGFWFRPDAAGHPPEALQGHRAWAVLIRRFLSEAGIHPWVSLEGAAESIGAVRVKSFRQGSDYWVGLANRMVRPDADHRSEPPDRYHLPLTNLKCAVRVESDAVPTAAYLLPMNRLAGEVQQAFPERLPLTVANSVATFTLPKLEGIAAVLLTRAYEPLVGISADHYHVRPGDRVRIVGRIMNTTAKSLTATVRVDAAEPLQVTSRPVHLTLAPGESRNVPFALRVPANAEPGHLLVQVVATRAGSAPRVSPSLELEVQPTLEISALGCERTLMPSLEGERELQLTGLARLPSAEVSLHAEVKVPQGFVATPSRLELRPDGSGRIAARVSLIDQETRARVGTGSVRIAGTVRGRRLEREYPLRLARGTVLYDETLVMKTGAAGEGAPTRLVALENDQIKANFVLGTAVLHDLVIRETNTDVLARGEYPFGMVLYGWRGSRWSEASRTFDGQRAELKLTSTSPDGHPVTMTATLRHGEPFVRVAYDFGSSGPLTESFYLMSRISLDGTRDVMILPRRSGVQERKWGETRFVDVPVAELAEPFLAVRNSATDEGFVVAFRAPAFPTVAVSSGSSGFNYMIFRPDAKAPPRRAVFLLAALKGSADSLLQFGRQLVLRLSE